MRISYRDIDTALRGLYAEFRGVALIVSMFNKLFLQ